MSRRGAVLFAAMCVIWGIPYLLIKVAVRDLSPAALVFGRTAIGALLLVPIAAARGDLRPVWERRWALLVYTVVEIGGPWLLLSTAERRLSSSLSGLLVAAVPLAGAVMTRVLRGAEPVDRRVAAGLLVGLAGVVALVGLDVGRADLGAVAMVAVVIVGYATGPVLISRTLSDLPSLGVVAASLAVCAVGYAPLALVQHPARVPPGRILAAVVVLGVLCTAGAFVLFFHLVNELGPLRATVITYVNPAVAVLLGVAFLHERFTAGVAVGFPLVLIGSYLATRGRSPAGGLAAPLSEQIAEP